MATFEDRLQADPTFAKRVQLYKELEVALVDPKAIALQEKLN